MAKRSRKRTLRIGFIGAGGIADLHIRLLSRRSDVEIVALADVSEDVLAERRETLPEAAVYRDHREMLKQEKLNAVSVCTPNQLHCGPTIDALKAGCHVLVEKPMATKVTECRRMIAAAKRARRKLVIGFQYRFDPRTKFIRDAAAEGQLGRVLYGRVQALRRRGIPNWGVFGQKALSGGGPLIDIGVHVLEMTHYAMGSPKPVSASADLFTYLGNKPSGDLVTMWPNWDHDTYTIEDLAVGRIRFANGAVIHIESAFAAHMEPTSIMDFQLMGECGGATWSDPKLFTDEANHMVNKTPGWLPDTAFDKVFKRKMDGFVDHCLYGEPTIAPAMDGLVVQAMLNGLYQSAEKDGRETKIRL